MVEDPNEAKAPDPRPKAEEADAPDVGEAMPEVLRGEIALNGFREPSDPPKRFELENRREAGCSPRDESLWSLSVDERELLLFRQSIVS